MFTGGVRFHTVVVLLIQQYPGSCSRLCHLFMVSPDVVGIGSEYFVVVKTIIIPKLSVRYPFPLLSCPRF